ncbi:MAG: Spy0128 family protein [Gemmiger sp.]
MKLTRSVSKTLRRAAAMLLGGAMLTCALATGVAAADAPTAVTVQFTKTLDMTAAPGASVPNTTFTYSIAPGTAVAPTAQNPEILAGVGTPTVGSAAFASTDTIDSNKLASHTVGVDFSSVTFPAAGIYRYTITETQNQNPDITNDPLATRTLDVYVVNDGQGGHTISHFVLMSSTTPPDRNGQCQDKSTGFTAYFTTYGLDLTKKVTGTMADLTKLFNFTIDFTGPANTTFTYGNQTVTIGANGTASITGIQLNNSTGAASITGLPSTVKFTITEVINANEGYTTTHSLNGDDPQSGTVLANITLGQKKNTVEFVNNRDAVSPTGLVSDTAPYLTMVLLAVGAALLLRRKRTER